MESASCSLWFLVARTDVPFMMQTIPHIIKMCNYPFAQKVVAVDTSPLSGDYISRPCIGTLTELQQCCDKLLTSGVVDRIINIDFSEHYQDKVYVKHLGIGWNEWRYYWNKWNHDGETQVTPADYIASGSEPGEFVGEGGTACPLGGDFGC